MEVTGKMNRTIIWASLSAAAVGIPGTFGAHLDVLPLGAIWVGMVVTLAKQAGSSMEKAKAAKIVAGVTAGIGSFAGGIKLATNYFAWTGVGTVPAMIANMGTNGVLTYLFGKAIARMFVADSSERAAEVIIGGVLAALGGNFDSGSESHIS